MEKTGTGKQERKCEDRGGMQWREGQKEVGGGKLGGGWIGEVQNEGEINE